MKDKIKIHIVNSVKGGCGKTAFSLFKALEVAKTERTNNMDSREAAVMWIDADFKGSASKCLFYGEDEKTFESMNKERTIEDSEKANSALFAANPLGANNELRFNKDFVGYTINDYLKENIREIEKMVVHGYVYAEDNENPDNEKSQSINGIIDFIFSSPRMVDKKLFNYGSGFPVVDIGRFTYLMKGLLKELLEIGGMKTRAVKKSKRAFGYKHIIIDMPPGDDAYSSALMHMIRQLAEEKHKDYDVEIHLYTLATSDRGHMLSMVGSLQDTLERLKHYEHEEKVYAVLSEIRQEEFKVIDFSKKEIQEIDGNKKINILKCTYQKEYYNFCRDITGKSFSYEIKEVTNGDEL